MEHTGDVIIILSRVLTHNNNVVKSGIHLSLSLSLSLLLLLNRTCCGSSNTGALVLMFQAMREWSADPDQMWSPITVKQLTVFWCFCMSFFTAR
jgi:hypothetical protein